MLIVLPACNTTVPVVGDATSDGGTWLLGLEETSYDQGDQVVAIDVSTADGLPAPGLHRGPQPLRGIAMLLISLLISCSGEKSTDEEIVAPAIEWVNPLDGDTETAGDVLCSLSITNFSLVSPALHNTGTPIGHLALYMDNVLVGETDSTTPTLTIEAGDHQLVAALLYADGDAVLATDTVLCDEDDEDAACAPVEAMINISAE